MAEDPLEPIDTFAPIETLIPLDDAIATPVAPDPLPPVPEILIPSPPLVAPEPMEEVRHYSETLSPAPQSVTVSFPFSLRIHGKLTPPEKEKLLEWIKIAELDIQPSELEMQFQSGEILIPQLSEFTAVWLAQALRDTQADLILGPAESVFPSRDGSPKVEPRSTPGHTTYDSASDPLPAESIPILADASFPGGKRWTILDSMVLSQTLKAEKVEVAHSPEFDEALEALRRELRFRAHRKGATAIISFRFSLTPLANPSHYRLAVSGIAIRHLM